MFGIALVFATPAVAQQHSLTQVPGVLMCSLGSGDDCFAINETELLKTFPDIVRRDSAGTTSVRLSNDKWLPITNEWVDFSNCWHALDMQKGDRYLTLGCVAEEEDWWVLVDRQVGKFYHFYGYPYLSPDNRHVAVGNLDDMNGNKFEIFSLGPDKATLLADLLGGSYAWWPDALCWADNATLIYNRIEIEGQTAAGYGDSKTTVPEHLKLQNGRWRISSGRPDNMSSCNELVS